MLYIGPEIMMPVVSALAAIGGVLLMFWRRVKGAFRAMARLVTGGEAPPLPDQDADPPVEKPSS